MLLVLKTLSGLSEDRRRYAILFRLGTDEREQSRALFQQTFSFFALPFALPLLLSIPAALVSAQIMRLGGYPDMTGTVLVNAAVIALFIAVIYGLYFTATYLIARKNVVQYQQE